MANLSDHFEVTDCVEALPFRREVLQKHLPVTSIHEDIRTFQPKRDYSVICGGSPCQDNSIANPKGKGIKGEQSSLWWEMFRIITKAKPPVVLWENPPGCAYPKGTDKYSPLAIVVGSLASVGYFCEWQVVSVSKLGGLHRRERLLLIAHSYGWEEEARGEVPKTWGRFVGEDAKALFAQWARESSTVPGVANGLSSQLDKNIEGWWKAHPFRGMLSMGKGTIENRYDRNSALGDSCSPQQSAIAWRHIHRILTWQHQQDTEKL